jgi:hypothetical protein
MPPVEYLAAAVDGAPRQLLYFGQRGAVDQRADRGGLLDTEPAPAEPAKSRPDQQTHKTVGGAR